MKKDNAVVLLIVSNVFFGVLPVLVKMASRAGYSAMQETFCRFAVGLLGTALLGVFGWQSLRVVNRPWVLARGILGAVSVIGYFIALQTTSAGVGTLLNYTYILWANVFAVVFFGQRPPRFFFVSLAVAAAGVCLVLNARLDHLGIGEMAGIFSGLTGGAAVLAIKRCRETDTALTVFGSFSVFSFVFSIAALVAGPGWIGPLSAWKAPDPGGLGLLVMIGLVSMAAQVLFSEALGWTSLALGSFLTLSVPVLAAIFGLFFLGEPLTPYFGSGLVLVLAACSFVLWQENRTAS